MCVKCIQFEVYCEREGGREGEKGGGERERKGGGGGEEGGGRERGREGGGGGAKGNLNLKLPRCLHLVMCSPAPLFSDIVSAMNMDSSLCVHRVIA